MGTAAVHGFDDIIKLLLDSGADANALGYLGKTPLLFAAQEGNESTFELLLKRGADPFAKCAGDKRTMLSWAAVNGHVKTAQFLIERGANMETLDKDGRSPLVLVA
ncbi:hypothetical protein CI102_11857, partial [Trichoderma harzianum]